MSNAIWWGQRKCNWDLIIAGIKADIGFLPYFLAWGRTHYMTAVPAMLRDLGKLSKNEENLLHLGCTFVRTSDKGNWSSLSYLTEMLNWQLKHFTPHLDVDGRAWIKTSERLEAYMLISEAVSGLFKTKSDSLAKDHQPNAERVRFLSSLIQKWNVLGIARAADQPVFHIVPSNLHQYWEPLFLMSGTTVVIDDVPGTFISCLKSNCRKEKMKKKELKAFRSEERRVGKECRSRWSPYH